MGMRRCRSPWLECSTLAVIAIGVHGGLVLVTRGLEPLPGGVAPFHIALLLGGLFLLGLLVAVVAVISGIGGGVIYTPLLLAFTPLHSVIVRATGLCVALFSGIVSSGIFLSRGVGNLKIAVLCNLGYSAGGFLGARMAIHTAQRMGERGEGFIRITLGALVVLLATYFARGGLKREWPEVRRVDRFTVRLRLCHPYYEPSLGRVVECVVTRAGWGLAMMTFIGFVAGFFGLGAGWAIVPALNFIMGVPLKMAAAISNVIIGIGEPLTIAPYLSEGAVVAVLVAPLIVGHVIGGVLGAQLLVHVRSASIRIALIGVLFYTSFGLWINGLRKLGVLSTWPPWLNVAVLMVVAVATAVAMERSRKERRSA